MHIIIKIRLFILSYLSNLLYNQFAFLYDFVAFIVSSGYWDKWTRSTISHLKWKEVLELGHGTGHLQIGLSENGFMPYGIDISKEMGLIAREKMTRFSHTSRLTNAYAQSLPFLYQSFAQVVSTFPTGFIFEQETIEEIYRVLKPRGELIILLSAWTTGKSLPERFSQLIMYLFGQFTSNIEDNFYFKQSNFKVHKELLELEHSKMLIIRAKKLS